MKRRKKTETAALADQLFMEKQAGAGSTELAEKYGLHLTYVNKLIREYKAGRFEDKPALDISEIVEITTAEQNRLCDKLRCSEIIVYDDEDISKNFKIKVQLPDCSDPGEYDVELQKIILEKLRWMHAGKEFKVN